MQADSLQGDVASVDVTTENNLKELEKVGQNLLTKSVSKLDLLTGQYKPVDTLGTNEEALKRYSFTIFCKFLSPISHCMLDFC